MRTPKVIVPVLAALAAFVFLAPPATAAPATTLSVRGIEYSATATEGRFGGIAQGELSGAWIATVAHEPLQPGTPVPITGGTLTLYREHPITGTFVGGSVAPLAAPAACGNEQFTVTGRLALSDGSGGAFSVVLTHLRVSGRTACATYGATVSGTLTIS